MSLTGRRLKFDKTKDANGKEIAYPYDINNNISISNTKNDFHVNNLLSKIDDVARANLFKVELSPPVNLTKDWDSKAFGLVTVLAKNVNVPSITCREVVIERAGIKIPIPTSSYDFGETSVTFLCDTNYDLRSLFIRWQKLGLADWRSGALSDANNYLFGSVRIFNYNTELDPTFGTELVYAWPQTIGEMSFSQDSKNQISEFTVTFKYSYPELYRAN